MTSPRLLVAFVRTLEWGAFDLNSRVVILPRG